MVVTSVCSQVNFGILRLSNRYLQQSVIAPVKITSNLYAVFASEAHRYRNLKSVNPPSADLMSDNSL
jgi:hypothetical protein